MQHHRKILTSVVQFVPSRHPTLVVASPGRSGSSMLFIELARAMSKERFGVGSTYLKDFAWDLSAKKLRRGMVYKTHDYPDALYGRESVRCVFVFGSAIDSVISTLKQEKIKGQGWIAAHLAHLKSDGEFRDVVQRDVLGILPQITAWSTFESCPVLCVRYEALWDAERQIREFTDLPFELPVWRARQSKGRSGVMLDQVRRNYALIDAKIGRLPDIFVAEKRMGDLLEANTLELISNSESK